MEQLKVEIKYVYKDKTSKVEKISLWNGYKPCLFLDDDNLDYVVIAKVKLSSDKEYDIFYDGLMLSRDLIATFINI